MHRFIQDTGHSNALAKSRNRQPDSTANMVEYGLLAILVIALIATGSTLMGRELTGVFSTVANAMEKSGRTESAVSYGQTTSRKGAPVERDVSGKLAALASSLLIEDVSVTSNER